MTPDGPPYRSRVRTLVRPQESGSVRAACRAMDIHSATFYRLR